MKVLIAGATGSIGRELLGQCLNEGIEVNYLTTSKDKLDVLDGATGYFWNPKKNEIDINAFDGVKAVINLAGATVSKRWTDAYKKKILESRLNTARLILNTLKNNDHSVEQYLSASGISLYPSSKTKLYDENFEGSGDTFLAEVVVEWEKAAESFSEIDIPVSIVRTGIVLAKEEGALKKIVQPIKMGFGAPLGSGDQWQSWIHIEDIAGIYLHLLKRKLAGVFNGVSGGPVTNKKMTKIIASELNKPLWMPNVPVFMLKLILGEMSALVLESQLVSAQKIEDSGYKFNYVNLERAIEELL
ncbi:MAG: TIGR01777 family protein [Flavobacteriaceae bacterium]|nr:TIGR01777 family protein [Flavobacteriaceae bacterium]